MNTLSHEEAFEAMATRRIARAEVEYSGGGDEGSVDRLTLSFDDGHEEDVTKDASDAAKKVWQVAHPGFASAVGAVPASIDEYEMLLAFFDDLPSWQYYSFAGEFDCHGTITIDRDARTITGEGSETEYVCEDVEFDFSDGPPEEWLADQNGNCLEYLEVRGRLAVVEATLSAADGNDATSLQQEGVALRTLKRALAAPATDEETAFVAQFKRFCSALRASQHAANSRAQATGETAVNQAAAKAEAAEAQCKAEFDQFKAMLQHFGAL